jgi:hypothetical protein
LDDSRLGSSPENSPHCTGRWGAPDITADILRIELEPAGRPLFNCRECLVLPLTRFGVGQRSPNAAVAGQSRPERELLLDRTHGALAFRRAFALFSASEAK